jgi:two-component system, repressor protein LuxO
MNGTQRPVRRASVLVVEDASSLQMIYRATLTRAGHAVRVCATAAAALTLFREAAADVVLLDLHLPDRDGLSLMHDLMALKPGLAVVAITGNGSVNLAVEAMRSGAHDFLVKPVEEARRKQSVDAALRGARRAVPQAPGPAASAGMIGSSTAMATMTDRIGSVARSMATVFITGESGTGKELVALAVHNRSARAAGPFIALNCGAIPQDLLESEVFGHMKGSFTGAISDKPGAAQAADGGTLFLDEVCEMALPLQTKLLRFLQTSTVQPVGATRPRKVDVRIVCATNQDPMEAVRHGQFREDLFYRLYVVPLHLPPLRDRGDDVIEIARVALARYSAEEGKVFDGLSPETEAVFRRHRWPGNVRQLLNVIRNVVVLHEGGVVTPAMLPDDLSRRIDLPTAEAPRAAMEDLLGQPLATIERRVIEATLARFGGSVPAAARSLDVAPSTLYRKLEAWGKG